MSALKSSTSQDCPLAFSRTITKWMERMKNVEKQTGKPMGITKIPAKAVKEGEAA
jgi:hypothetical protein